MGCLLGGKEAKNHVPSYARALKHLQPSSISPHFGPMEIKWAPTKLHFGAPKWKPDMETQHKKWRLVKIFTFHFSFTFKFYNVNYKICTTKR